MSKKDLKDLVDGYDYATNKFGKIEMMSNINVVNVMSENRMDDHMSKLEESFIKEIRDEKNIEVFDKLKDKLNLLFKDIDI